MHVVVVRCILLEVWRMLPIACCVTYRGCSLHIARCMAHVVRMLCVARCVSSVAFSQMHVACRLLFVAHFSSGCLRHCCPLDLVCVPFLRRMSHVLTLPVFGCPPQCPMPHGVRCLSHAPRRISSVACAALRVVGCMLHVARPEPHVVSCVLPVPSCMSSHRHACYPHARTHSCLHAHLGLQQVLRPLRRSIASAAAGVRAPEASRRKARRTSHVFDHKGRGHLPRHQRLRPRRVH